MGCQSAAKMLLDSLRIVPVYKGEEIFGDCYMFVGIPNSEEFFCQTRQILQAS